MSPLLKYPMIALIIVVVAYFAKIEYDRSYTTTSLDLECIERYPGSVGTLSKLDESWVFCSDASGNVIGFFNNPKYTK